MAFLILGYEKCLVFVTIIYIIFTFVILLIEQDNTAVQLVSFIFAVILSITDVL